MQPEPAQELNMPGLNDYTTTLPGLYQDAKAGDTRKIEEFMNDFINFQFKELRRDATLTWVQRTSFEPPQSSRRFQIAYRGIVVAYGAVSAGATLEMLKDQESKMLRDQVLVHNNRELGYVIVTVKQDGLQAEFAEVKNGVLNPLIPGRSLVNLEIDSDETRFKDLLDHCLRFAH